jgi:uncharacterized protein with ParB-like and HNH nuclease domain
MPKPPPKTLYLLTTKESYMAPNKRMYDKFKYYSIVNCGKPLLFINEHKCNACYYGKDEAQQLQKYLLAKYKLTVQVTSCALTNMVSLFK